MAQKICLLLQKETSKRDIKKRHRRDPRSIFLETTFTPKVPRSSDSMYSSCFKLENIWQNHFTWSGPNIKEKFSSSCRSLWTLIKLEQIPQFFVNSIHFRWMYDDIIWQYHMFFSIKMEEYMKPEISGFFLS